MDGKRKFRKRKCSVCGRWFLPDPRVKHRQKTCGKECRKKREARQQADWRKKRPEYREETRLRRAMRMADQEGATIEIKPRDGRMARLPWAAVQMALGAKKAVVLAFALRLLEPGCVTAIRVRIRTAGRAPGRLLDRGVRNGDGGRGVTAG